MQIVLIVCDIHITIRFH